MRRRPAPLRALLVTAALGMAATLCSAPAIAQDWDPNACDAPEDSPNVIVGDLYELQRWGQVGDIVAFSVGTMSCNVGSCWLDWIAGADRPEHPTIGQNAFRIENGRIEQLGQSWLKHGFYALSDTLCSPVCLPTDGEHLGVNCSDPYSSGLNGQQSRLGPKFEVNPVTGEHPHPVSMQDRTGDEIFKRLQIHERDLDPALHPGARYFVEGQYIAADDARAGHQHDNASYREVRVVGTAPGGLDLQFAAETVRTLPAIRAWADGDPGVLLASVDDPEGGRFWMGAKATDLGGGLWSYEYAVHNLDSRLGAGFVSVPMAPSLNVSAVGFHDVEYHSGEPFDGTDWNPTRDPSGALTWSTVPYRTSPDANALRWGTLYNYRFVAPAPPVPAAIALGLFKPGAPGDARRIAAVLIAPGGCDGDGTCDAGESCLSCPGECAGGPPDTDGDGVGLCDDCDDNDPKAWGLPGEALALLAWRDDAGLVELSWDEPLDPGSTLPTYEVLRAIDPSDFGTGVTCLRGADVTARELTDAGSLSAGPFLSYLVRARNRCAAGVGTTGYDSFDRERTAVACP